MAGRQNNVDFFRINVSYEFWNIGFYAQKEGDVSAWRFQVGLVGLWGDDGFYNYDPSETGGREVTASKPSLEPYFGLERLARSTWLGQWNWYFSLDARPKSTLRKAVFARPRKAAVPPGSIMMNDGKDTPP